MRGEDLTDTYPVLTIGVLECNRIAIAVYRSCQWTLLIPSMGGSLVHAGVSAQEIVASLRLHSVPRSEWPGTEDRVRIMIDAASMIYAERRKTAEEKARDEAKRRAAEQSGKGRAGKR